MMDEWKYKETENEMELKHSPMMCKFGGQAGDVGR